MRMFVVPWPRCAYSLQLFGGFFRRREVCAQRVVLAQLRYRIAVYHCTVYVYICEPICMYVFVSWPLRAVKSSESESRTCMTQTT
jgi:hypothetical protein